MTDASHWQSWNNARNMIYFSLQFCYFFSNVVHALLWTQIGRLRIFIWNFEEKLHQRGWEKTIRTLTHTHTHVHIITINSIEMEIKRVLPEAKHKPNEMQLLYIQEREIPISDSSTRLNNQLWLHKYNWLFFCCLLHNHEL